MARRFFYTSLGILCLTAAYQLGAERARASWIANSGHIIGGFHHVWLTADGEVWEIVGGSQGWQRRADLDPPVPVSEVKFYEPNVNLITTSDVGWQWVTGQWIEIGPIPGGPVELDRQSWGSVKGEYR